MHNFPLKLGIGVPMRALATMPTAGAYTSITATPTGTATASLAYIAVVVSRTKHEVSPLAKRKGIENECICEKMDFRRIGKWLS